MRAKILNAGAGSGKTYQLAYKYVCDVIQEPDRYRHILAVTFTNKATEEMKSRILERIHELASDAPSPYLDKLCDELEFDAATVRQRARRVRSKILHDYSHFTVLTIDKFFQRILRAFIRELGIAPDYTTEIETDSIVGRGADTLVEQITTDKELRRWLMEFVEERIEQGRRWDIREGILSLSGELFKEQNRTSLGSSRSKEELSKLIDNATSEAKRTHRQMQLLATEGIMLITAAGLSPSDFPYKDKGFVAYFYKNIGTIPEPYGKRVSEACRSNEVWDKGDVKISSMREVLQPLLTQMCDLYDSNINAWNTATLLSENYRSFALLSDLYLKVRQMCGEENLMLLSETKYILSEFIGQNDAPFIYEKAGNRYDRFMIDEFQDTSVREWENFLPLLQNAMAQSEETSVLLVGDIKQSIYRWRGGDWRVLHSAAPYALGDDTQVEYLKENYRSLSTVVDFNNKIIGTLVAIDNLQLNTTLSDATASQHIDTKVELELRNTLARAYNNHDQSAARRADREGYVCIETFDQTPPLISHIKECLDRGFRPRDILILVRTNTEGVRVADTLLEFKQQNKDPRYRFDVMTQEALTIGNAPICAFIVAALRLTINPNDTLSLAVYNHYLGNRSIDSSLSDEDRLFCHSTRLLSPEEAFEQIVIHHKLQNRSSETAYLQAIHDTVIRFCSRKVADIALFLKWWDEKGHNQSLSVEQSDSTIGIMTIHKSKGLQNKIVIIPYCSWSLPPDAAKQPIVWSEANDSTACELGRFPVRYKKSMAESHFAAEYYRELIYTHVDNINLLYVALTRAEEALYIFIPQHARTQIHAGALILSSLNTMKPRKTTTMIGERFEFGEATAPATQKNQERSAQHIILDNYPTSEADLRLRLPSQRYFEQGEQELAPRSLGILLHKAFEQASNLEDIQQAIQAMRTDSLISTEQATTLRAAVERALTEDVARDWFSGKWERVRNENEIVVPGDNRARRPDRVMICGSRAVIVDYKFGVQEAEKYRTQINEYGQLLSKIGYTEVEGYLWYVKLGKIEKVI